MSLPPLSSWSRIVLRGALLTTLLSTTPSTAVAGEDSWDDADGESAKVARTIEELMGFFVVKHDKRDPLETVVVDGNAAEIWYLHAMRGPDVAKARCDAYRWLFFGRLRQARGVKAVFERFDHLDEVKLVFFDVKTRIHADGRRGYRQLRKTSPRMEVTLTRETALALNYGALRSRMKGPRCVAEAERAVDQKWYRD